MIRTAGLLVVSRVGMLRRAASRVAVPTRRGPGPVLEIEEIRRRYRGFDGEPWPQTEHPGFAVEDGLARLADEAAVRDYLRNLPPADEADLLLLDSPWAVNADNASKRGWSGAGYDVGYFESEWSHFSIVLNGVLLGFHSELRGFAARLNEHLLFRTIADARAVLKEYECLARLGKDVEQGRFEVIAIFSPDLSAIG